MQDPRLTTILNGFGISLGDSIIGMQALAAARAVGAIEGRVVLGRVEPAAKPLVPQVYRLAGDLAEVLPMGLAPRSGRVIDIRDFAFDPEFSRVSMIDFFLMRLGIAPERIPPALKRNLWLAPRLPALPPLDLPQDYLLFCPGASIPLRDMPAPVRQRIAQRLVDHGPVLAQGDPLPGTIQAPQFATIESLAALVAGARAVISTDTAMVHLADAFDRPCLAFFTTHRPEWRVRDYPGCTAVHLPAPNLPESLEFPRGPADLAAARLAWFPTGQDFDWLDRRLDQFLATLPGA
ncbi:glycosyltransferase family 9 protein [Acidisoma sp. 7E03]